MIRISDKIIIEQWEIVETFNTSRGPGGQNVNKVSTAVELRFSAANSPNLTSNIKSRLKKISGNSWTSDGILIINVQKTRSQYRNRILARQKLRKLILEANHPIKKRIPTKPSYGIKEKRINQKKTRGIIKTLRGRVNYNE
jgi:ribosome-associated protein